LTRPGCAIRLTRPIYIKEEHELAATRIDDLLTALADPTRRAIVEMLSAGPRRAGEIHAAFPIADPAISRHLRVLREAGVLVEGRVATDARVRLYELAPAALAELAGWLHRMMRPEQAQLDAFRDYVTARTATVERSAHGGAARSPRSEAAS
jgi:DNA-binding transcriptional ArsR family regulator